MDQKPRVRTLEELASDLIDFAERQRNFLTSQQQLLSSQHELLLELLERYPSSRTSGTSDLQPEFIQTEKSCDIDQENNCTDGSSKGLTTKVGTIGRGPFLAKHGLSLFLPIALGAVVLLLLLGGPTDVKDLRRQMEVLRQKRALELAQYQDQISRSNNEIGKLQSIVIKNQNALAQTEEALAQAQDSLKIASARYSPSTKVPLVPLNPAPLSTTSLFSSLSKDQQFRDLQSKIAEIRTSIIQNNKDYLEAAHSLAENLRGLAIARAQAIARVSGTDVNTLPVLKTQFDDYLPEEAKRLQERQLNEPVVVSPAIRSIDDAQSQIATLNRQLFVAERRLESVQSDLTDTERQLNEAINGLRTK